MAGSNTPLGKLTQANDNSLASRRACTMADQPRRQRTRRNSSQRGTKFAAKKQTSRPAEKAGLGSSWQRIEQGHYWSEGPIRALSLRHSDECSWTVCCVGQPGAGSS